jgi:hypothetical protein
MSSVFWNETPYRLVEVCWRLRGTCYLDPQATSQWKSAEHNNLQSHPLENFKSHFQELCQVFANYSVMPVPSNATQGMYNIQFNLLISQHVSTVFRSSSGEYNCLPNALLNCKPSYFLYGPIFTMFWCSGITLGSFVLCWFRISSEVLIPINRYHGSLKGETGLSVLIFDISLSLEKTTFLSHILA